MLEIFVISANALIDINVTMRIKYIKLVLTEKHYGRDAMLALVAFEKKRYAVRNRNNLQSPILLVDATLEHDINPRVTLVFAQLQETVGDDVIIAALTSL